MPSSPLCSGVKNYGGKGGAVRELVRNGAVRAGELRGHRAHRRQHRRRSAGVGGKSGTLSHESLAANLEGVIHRIQSRVGRGRASARGARIHRPSYPAACCRTPTHCGHAASRAQDTARPRAASWSPVRPSGNRRTASVDDTPSTSVDGRALGHCAAVVLYGAVVDTVSHTGTCTQVLMAASHLHPYAAHLGSALRERFSAQTVAAGLAAAAAGTAAAVAVSAAWWCSSAVVEAARAECCSTFVISSRSQVFAWLKVWLSAQPDFAQTAQRTTVQLAEELDKGLLASDSMPAALGFSAAEQSTHWFRRDGGLLAISLRRERIAGHQDKEELLLELHSWPGRGAKAGRRSQVVALVEEARQTHAAQTQGRTELFIGQPE